MTCKELIKKVRTHPAVVSSIPIEAEMQWPRLLWENGALFVQFFFCYTELEGRTLRMEAPRYRVKLRYPFQRVVLLEDLACRQDACSGSPSNIELTGKAQANIRENGKALFQTIDEILAQFEERETVNPALLAEQDRLLQRLVPPARHALYFDPAQGGVKPCG